MDREPWLLASTLLARRGAEALDAVSVQLATLQRLVQRRPAKSVRGDQTCQEARRDEQQKEREPDFEFALR
jgi:hypothetical protein